MVTSRPTFDDAEGTVRRAAQPAGGYAAELPECLRFLGLAENCTEQEVRAAYKRKAHACHPDQGGEAAAFRHLADQYEQALRYVTSRPGATPDYQAVLIDGLRYVRTSEGRLARYRRHLLVAILTGLAISWWFGHLVTAMSVIGVCGLMVLPAITAPLRPIYAGSAFLVLSLLTLVFLMVGGQTGAFSEEGYAYELIGLALAGMTVMTMFAWLISLADHNR